MTGAPALPGGPVQVAYAVPDAVAAAHRWAAEVGAGPFFVRSHIGLVDVVHRGRPATFDHTSAYGQWGPIMVELVEDHTDGPSVIRDVVADRGYGLHHLAFFVPDLDEAVGALIGDGHQLAMSARTAGGLPFRFVDTVAGSGHMVELYEPTARLLRFYETVADAARGWDGTDPVRQ